MDEHAATSVRRKRDASINVCMRLVREGRADAVVTAGHTGAGVASAILNLGRLPRRRPARPRHPDGHRSRAVRAARHRRDHGLDRPQPRPVRADGRDVRGAGAGRRRPIVALLSIGEEGGKGEQRVQEATELLAASDLRFIGNVEGKDLPQHPADVVVCDASVGNVMIKFFEGLSTVIFDMLRAEFKRPPWGPIGYLFMRPGIEPHPPALRLRAAGRRAAAGRQGHGADHPRPRQAAHDRLRGRGRRGGAEARIPRRIADALA